jgi:RHS repeat-associated protein
MATTVRYTTIQGEVITEKRAGVRRTYVPDPLGSTVALLDSTQAQTDTFTYWPYGEEKSRTGTTATPFRFVGTLGYYRDNNSRVYVRARTFKADCGRWLTEDPIGFRSMDLNMYRYSENSPTCKVDPSGEDVWRCCITGAVPHCFISTSECGAWGFYPKSLIGAIIVAPMGCTAGQVNNNDNYLLPCDPKVPNVICPGKGDPKQGVSCTRLAGISPSNEHKMCQCMMNDLANPPLYCLWANCRTWASGILNCGGANVIVSPW